MKRTRFTPNRHVLKANQSEVKVKYAKKKIAREDELLLQLQLL